MGLLNSVLGLEPFNPAKHSPQDVGLGGMSTEFLVTDYDPQGKPFNYPTIWFDQGGRAYYLPDQAYSLAIDYENATGRRFPRFDEVGQGAFSAMNRSAMGGASTGLLSK